MKPVFGMLLVGGSIILIVGIFIGKVQFSLPANGVGGGTAQQPVFNKQTGANPIVHSKLSIIPPVNGKCPAGYTLMDVTGGGKICFLNG